MRTVSIIMAGFGNVGRAFVRLVQRKHTEVVQNHKLDLQITGISTGSHGSIGSEDGLDLEACISQQGMFSKQSFSNAVEFSSTEDMIASSSADVFLENTPVNYQSGQPAVSYLRQALENEMHVVTANKGPVVHAYRQLTDLAAKKGKKFLFESTVMDGAPVFSVVREALPAIRITGFEGILNSCTNLILCKMEEGESFEEAVRYAQSIGIAETDPSGDVDGWDAAIKVAALSTVLLDHPVTPQDVDRTGIASITQEDIQAAKAEGKRWKLICSAQHENGEYNLTVKPQMVTHDTPYFNVEGTSSYIAYKTDVLPELGLGETNPSPDTTAYGLLADILNIYKYER